MALPRQQTIDIPLVPINERGVPSTAVAGELLEVQNGIAEKYNEGSTALSVSKRAGFARSTQDVRSVASGANTGTGFPSAPTLLSSLGSQTVVASDARPHVLADNAESWSQYAHTYSPSTARQHVVFGGNMQIANPDAAEIGSVRAYTWSEPIEIGEVEPFIRLFFVDANGTAIRTPFKLGSSDATQRCRVVSDGTRFWVVYNELTSLRAQAYDTNGEQIGTTLSFGTLDTSATAWDLTFQAGYVLVCQAAPLATVVKVTRLSISGTTLSAQVTTLNNATGNFGAQWGDNPNNDGFVYLLTVNIGESASYTVHAYRLGSISTTPVVNAFMGTSGTGQIYSGTGEVGEGVGGVPVNLTAVRMADTYLHVQISYFDWLLSVGPGDHRKSRTVMLRCLPASTTPVVDRIVRGVIQASRPFVLPGTNTYMIAMYYPSALTTTLAPVGAQLDRRVFAGQPTYFLMDLTTGQVTGRFYDGVAGMEWTRIGWAEINTAAGPYFFSLPHTFLDASLTLHLPLGVDTQSVAVMERQKISGQDIIQFLDWTRYVNAVNYHEMRIGKAGQAVEYGSELLMPGCLATSFMGYEFREQGVNLAPEQVSMTRQTTGSGALALLGTYEYIAAFEWTAPNGRRVRSATSIPQHDTLVGANNSFTVSGLIFHQTTHPDLSISLYRTIMENGVQSTLHYKVTNDLEPILNAQGDLTWSFIDNMSDAAASTGEVLYTDMGFLNRDPCPPFVSGGIIDNRVFVVAPDNSIWFSGEDNDTDPLWFNRDTNRFPMPTTDPVVRLERLDGRLLILCESSIWWVPGGRWPAGNGLGGAMEAPTRLGFTNGCTGHSVATRDGVAYAASCGGVWLVTRGLENLELSATVTDSFGDTAVTGIAIDADQRIAFALTGSTRVQMVWDQLSKVWSKWVNATDILLTWTINGRFCYVDDDSMRVQDTSVWYDDDFAGVPQFYTMVISASYNLLNIKGLKRVWEWILTGERRAACTLTLLATYTTEDTDETETWSFVPLLAERFENQFCPRIEEMSRLVLRLSDAAGPGGEGDDSTGDSVTWELASFNVGTEGGLTRIPPTTRRRSST